MNKSGGTDQQRFSRTGGADPTTAHRPLFLDLSREADRNRLQAIKDAKMVWQEADTFYAQVNELLRINAPEKYLRSKPSAAEIEAYEGHLPPLERGNWVYYPWNGHLVHILKEADFIRLRTNRNRNKIQEAEAALLSQKTVGIVGLSVGQSLAVTIAMERSCGKMILADFDELDLSNLNRLRAGVHQVGLHKGVIAARAIAEIDPYLEIELFQSGINPDNVEAFVSQADLIADECDSLEIKILLRQFAQRQQKPVVMETSDRGLLDVERYDLEPDRAIFHGRIAHLEPLELPVTDPNIRQQLLFSILDVQQVSERLRNSYAEIGKTLLTWPQLASAVSLGAGIAADTIRRILLGQFCDSGRYYVDLERLVAGPNTLLSKK